MDPEKPVLSADNEARVLLAMAWLDEPMEPNPVIDAIKAEVDRSLLRANLERTIDERLDRVTAMQRLIEDLREAKAKLDPPT